MQKHEGTLGVSFWHSFSKIIKGNSCSSIFKLAVITLFNGTVAKYQYGKRPLWLANPQELTQNHSHGQSQHTCKKGACRLEHNTYRQIGLTREDLAQSCTSSGTKFAPAFACACLSVKLGILLWDFSCSISRSRKVAPKVLKHNIHGNIISGYHHAIAVGNANFRETATSINRVLPFVCHVVPRSFVWSFASELWQLLLYGVFSCNEKGQTWTDGGPAC